MLRKIKNVSSEGSKIDKKSDRLSDIMLRKIKNVGSEGKQDRRKER